MRSPSLYSQDDPISAALKPPETETEAERTARLYAEAEAKRVSEQIDEHLREERERIRKRKGDVKVCLLLSSFTRIYSPMRPAFTSGAGRKRKIDAAKAVPTDVSSPLSRARAFLVADCYIL